MMIRSLSSISTRRLGAKSNVGRLSASQIKYSSLLKLDSYLTYSNPLAVINQQQYRNSSSSSDNNTSSSSSSTWENIKEDSNPHGQQQRNTAKNHYRTNSNQYIGRRNENRENEWSKRGGQGEQQHQKAGERQEQTTNITKPLKQRCEDFLKAPLGIGTPVQYQKTGIKLIYLNANLNNVIGVEQAEQILKRLIQEKHWYDENHYSRCIVVNTKLYNFVMRLWSKVPDCHNRTRVNRVLKIWELLKCEEVYDKEYRTNKLSQISLESSYDKDLYYNPTQPDRFSFTFVITALANAGEIKQAKLYLKQLIQKYMETKDAEYVPPVPVFGAILSSMSTQASQPGDGKQAYKMLQLMKQLHLMVMQNQHNNNEDQHQHKSIQSCQPDAQAYSVVMNTYINSREPNFPDVVEKLLQEMIDEYTAGNNPSAKPDIVVLSIVIKAWSQAASLHNKPQAARKAEKWLAFLLDQYQLGRKQQQHGQQEDHYDAANDLSSIDILKPTTECFNYVLNAYTQSNREDAITRSEVIFQKFIYLTKKDPLFPAKPDTTSFNTLLNCYARKKGASASTAKVDKLLKQMEEEYGLTPDNYTYCTIFKYWMKSKEKLKVQRSKALLDSIENKYFDSIDATKPQLQSYVNDTTNTTTSTTYRKKVYPPSNAVYTSVINVCTSVGRQGYYTTQEEKQQAYNIAKEIFYNYKQKIPNSKCDFYLYLSMFQACHFLLPNTTPEEHGIRLDELWNVMKLCTIDGVLSPALVKKLNEMLDGKDFKLLMRKKDSLDPIETLMD